MSKPIDHIAYLSQEIGPRPAGTEEEQQAALYITERFQKETRLPVNIEDFTCSSNAEMPKLICYIVTIVAVLLGLFLPIAVIPAIVAAVLSAGVFVAESFDKPLLSQLFMKGVSQNVVAKYEPTYDPDGAGARRRKVIVVANYDSGKVRHDLAGFLPSIKRPVQYAVLGAMCLVPFTLLIRQFAFAGEGIGATVCMAVALVLLAVIAMPAVFVALEKASAYNEGANSNAAGVAVMLEVARRIGSGEAASASFAEGIMHDEETARAAGVVPEGSSLSYERSFGDISGNLVQVKDAPLSDEPTEEDMSRARKETRSALASAPIETLAAAAAKAAELHEAAEAAEAARLEQEEAERRAAELEAQERERMEEEARRAAEAALAAPAPSVPEWYLKATEKARKSEPSMRIEGSSYRSRYADFPDGHEDHEEAAAEQDAAEIQEIPGSVEQVPYVDDFAADGSETVEDAANEGVSADAASFDEEKREEQSSEAGLGEPGAPKEESEHLAAEEGRTTAMPPVAEAGSLDLDALRAAAASMEAADASEEAGESAAADEAAAEPEGEGAAPAADASDASTTRRIPQMMYYQEPEDRSEEMRERALKERAVVSLTADEAQDISVAVREAEPVVSAAQVSSIPVTDSPEPAVSAGQPLSDNVAASTAAMPAQPMPAAPAADAAARERVIAPRIPVVDLPSITLPSMSLPDPKPISFDELRQRAPLASAAESKGKEAATDLLSISLPSINQPPSATGSFSRMEGSQVQNTSVSLTGSFAPVGAIGAEPVGDELIEDVDPDEIYVDDADDSVFEDEFTETGAFAGPGYVEMPQSRVGRFFGKFRRKKKEEEQSAHEWLDVDEDFDARSAGKARGSWESFREDDDDWQGGAFGGLKARLPRKDEAPAEGEEEQGRARLSAPAVSHDAFAAALAAANAAAEAKGEKVVSEDDPYDDDDVQQIYSFAAGDINTEVWFVALGSELAGNGGIKAFLAEHAADMRGAVIVNLESLGAGSLSYLEKEGELRQTTCSPRMKRFVRKASQASGVDVQTSRIDWRESAASYAQKHRMQAMTLVGMDGNKPAFYGQADDIIENIDAAALDRSADMVVELLKNI